VTPLAMGLDEAERCPLPSGPTSWPSLCPSGLKEVSWMTWEIPSFIEVKMDAEVNSYQEDYEGI